MGEAHTVHRWRYLIDTVHRAQLGTGYCPFLAVLVFFT